MDINQNRNINGREPSGRDNYSPISALAYGDFSSTYKCLNKKDHSVVVVKAVRKDSLIKNAGEVRALRKLKSQKWFPNFVEFFETRTTCYLVTDYVPGMTLAKMVHSRKTLDGDALRFYMAELFIAICGLRKFFLHRNINPHNILIGKDGHIVITGFDEAVPRQDETYDGERNPIRGSLIYCAPELIMAADYTSAVDWWGFAMVGYYLATGGRHAFLITDDELDTFFIPFAIVVGSPDLEVVVSLRLRHLLKGILKREPDKRLASTSAADIENHPYFEGINWRQVFDKELLPPFYPGEHESSSTEKPVIGWHERSDN